MNIIEQIKNQVIISVQAMPNEPLYKEECLNALMESVINGGAKALRLAAVEVGIYVYLMMSLTDDYLLFGSCFLRPL